MRHPHLTTIATVVTFFISVFTIALIYSPYNPTLIISGEESVGTWMSGVLLVTSATASLIISMRMGWFPWWFIAIFFLVLALDERFMYHEQLKERIIFSSDHPAFVSRWTYELPVLAGAAVGVGITIILWRNLRRQGRLLLVGALLLGSTSVIMDVLDWGVFVEDSCKLLGELTITVAILREVESL